MRLFFLLIFGVYLTAAAKAEESFVSVWKMKADDLRLVLPLVDGYSYDFTVDWGDGTADEVNGYSDSVAHTYASADTYTVTISGLLQAWSFSSSRQKDRDKLLAVPNLGNVGWVSLSYAFADCKNLTETAGGSTDGVTNMSNMFRGATTVIPDTSGWDTSNVTDMSGMFAWATQANPDVSGWNTSKVTTMWEMFSFAYTANPDVSSWDTSSVTDMSFMFYHTRVAQPDVHNWDVSKVRNMKGMFGGTAIANPDMSNWNFFSIVAMHRMFEEATLPTSVYSAMLVQIQRTTVENRFAVWLDGGNSKYNLSAQSARSALIEKDWKIEDGGLDVDDSDVPPVPDDPPPSFVSIWKLDESKTIRLPLPHGYNYDFTVDWGDGTIAKVTSYDDHDATHVYTQTFRPWQGLRFLNVSADTITVTIGGLMEAWNFQKVATSRDRLIAITDLGDVGWKNLDSAFWKCRNLKRVAGGNTSGVTSMRGLFYLATAVKPDISEWNTSSVTTMRALFHSAFSANPDVSNWDTANVTDMSLMFSKTLKAKPNVSEWNTAMVTKMRGMFWRATSANPDVSKWDTSSVTDMAYMFYKARKANPDVSKWNVSRVTSMKTMFAKTDITNPDVSKWNTSNVTDMSFMFYRALQATPRVHGWNTANVKNMKGMFWQAIAASPEVDDWNTAMVTDARYMFAGAVSAQPNMTKWNFVNLRRMSKILAGITLPTPKYSQLLRRIDETTKWSKVVFGGGDSKYNSLAVSARQRLVSRGWQIKDRGRDE